MNPPPTARPATAPITFDLPCLGCRYNLRSLPVENICPECALPIRRTLEHGWLIFSDPNWLEKLRSGISFLLGILLVGVIGVIGLTAYVVIGTGATHGPNPIVLAAMGMTLSFTIVAMWLRGIWRLTSPTSTPGHQHSKLGHWIRDLNITSALVYLISGPLASILATLGMPDKQAASLWFGGAVLAWSVYVLSFLLLLVYMRRLARRVFKPTLDKLISFVLWGGVLLALPSAILLAIAMESVYKQSIVTTLMVTISPAFSPVPTMSVGVVFAAGFYLVVLVWGGAWLLALISFRRILKQTIHENASAAYAAWLNPPPPVAP